MYLELVWPISQNEALFMALILAAENDKTIKPIIHLYYARSLTLGLVFLL